MNSNSLERDELLEKAIYKFVNDKEQFQSRHYKNPKLKSEFCELDIEKLQSMPIALLLQLIFQKNKKKIHKSYRKDYFQHLQTLSREGLISLVNVLEKKEINKEIVHEIKQKLRI